MPSTFARTAVVAPLDVQRIALLPDPVQRNLQITQCYCELSAAFAQRTGPLANWCTFATWASKQAGQTIRKEDLKQTLQACLAQDAEAETALLFLATIAGEMRLEKTAEQLRQSVIGKFVSAAAEKAATAVGRGNKKVFEEIALQFARFLQTCLQDIAYSEAHIETFCQQLKPGEPPEGQDRLQKAFRHAYAAFFETDEKRKSELCLLANLEIGFHEQTRLQPEIAEALNAGTIDVEAVKNEVQILLLQDTGFWQKAFFLFKRFVGKTALLDEAIAALTLRVQEQIRRLLTANLMTLTLPPENHLYLGKDLTTSFPAQLATLTNTELLSLLRTIDPTPDSLRESGATDWASLNERLHFIADLFRCYQYSTDLFSEAFTAAQTAVIKAGQVPEGPL